MDPMTMAAVSTGANLLGGLTSGIMGRKDRQKAREMENLRRGAIKRSAGLGNQVADYAESVGTPQDAMFYGGLAGSKYKSNLNSNKEAFGRAMSRRGVNPNSGAFMSNFGGGADEALGEANAYNRALFGRLNEGTRARTGAQDSVMAPYNAAGQMQSQDEANAASSGDFIKGLVGGGVASYGKGLAGSADKTDPSAYADQMQKANMWSNAASMFAG